MGDEGPRYRSKLDASRPEWRSAFVAHAIARGVPFAMETVFSHWIDRGGGKFDSKIQLIEQMQKAGYFVLLLFVGLSSQQLSVGRVLTRVSQGGHAVSHQKLIDRFPRTQKAVSKAVLVADAAVLTDNSRTPQKAFTVCQVRLKEKIIFDLRHGKSRVPHEIAAWMNVVVPV